MGSQMTACIILGIAGLVLIVLGFLVWKKQKISLFHSYHVAKVSEKDKSAFCKVSGIGLLIIGTGTLISGILVGVTYEMPGLVCFAAGFIIGFVMLIYSEIRYNK